MFYFSSHDKFRLFIIRTVSGNFQMHFEFYFSVFKVILNRKVVKMLIANFNLLDFIDDNIFRQNNFKINLSNQKQYDLSNYVVV